MNKKIIIAVLIVVLVLLAGYFLDQTEDIYTAEEAEEIAESWITEEAPTFTERGGEELNLEETNEIDDSVFEVVFSFESSFAGYGEDEGEMSAQVITPHTTVITIDSNEVVSAVTDEVFDEMSGEMLEEDEDQEETATVDLYFVQVTDGVEETVSVSREIELVNGIEESTIAALLEGVTDEEEENGLSTSIPEETELLSFNLEDGVATVNFSEEIEPGGGSAWVESIREQIESTLNQFENVEEVTIMVEGESEEILQP